jgi:tetratricopeptide (TPR) repeat protein
LDGGRTSTFRIASGQLKSGQLKPAARVRIIGTMRISPWLAALACCAALAGPAAAQTAAQTKQRSEMLDRMFKSLRSAPDEATAGMLEQRIKQLWVQQASPAALLLLGRANRELNHSATQDALDDFDALLDLEPDFAEGYTQRAIARAEAGDTQGAIADIEQALQRDPRHFTAFEVLSHIAEDQGNWQGALKSWQKALDIDPRTPGGADRLETLQNKVDGQAT